jgi:hypothetical protein
MDILYIGSTNCKIENLENNHRNARSKKYDMTTFRSMLEEKHTNSGVFEWLVAPSLRTQREVEELERDLIRKHLPIYNKDYDPVLSSEKYGRYLKEEANEKRMRGVYCFKDKV